MLPLADTAKQTRPAVVTGLLVVANVAVFLWQAWLWFDHGKPALAGFVMEHALVPRRLVAHPGDANAWLTVFTHMFMHGGIAHILGNMWFLHLFGSGVEARLGPMR
ncbi:MAG: rhomboid family intramembrane serine protease, partial [Opitutaceae bacterium]